MSQPHAEVLQRRLSYLVWHRVSLGEGAFNEMGALPVNL